MYLGVHDVDRIRNTLHGPMMTSEFPLFKMKIYENVRSHLLGKRALLVFFAQRQVAVSSFSHGIFIQLDGFSFF